MARKQATVTVDLRKASLSDFVTFVFRHRASRDWESSESWYWRKDYEVHVDPVRQISHFRALFRSSSSLLRPFSEAQIEDGFWFMMGPACQSVFRDQLWNPAVPWPLRRDCVSSIPRLYTGAFRKSVGTISYMLWDLLLEDYSFGYRKPNTDVEDHRVQLAMFHALRIQLGSPYHEAQRSALHGMAHVGIPRATTTIRSYLRAKRRPVDLASYAEQVLAGEAY